MDSNEKQQLHSETFWLQNRFRNLSIHSEGRIKLLGLLDSLVPQDF